MRSLLALGLLALTATAASAQSPPDDRNIDIQIFEPALGAHSFLTVSGAEVMSGGQFQLALGVSYMTHPLTVFLVDPDDMSDLSRRSEVISSIVSGNVSFAYGITDRLQAGVLLPVVFSMEGDGLDTATGMPEAGGLSVRGLGDARLELAWRIYDKKRMTLAVIPALTVPTSTKLGSDDDAFLGDDLPTFRPRAAWEWTAASGKVSVGANLGLILRKARKLYSTDVGQQITYGVAAAWHVTPRLDLVGELFGRQGFQSDLDASPLEADGALKVEVSNALALFAGGGAGLVKGVGAPSVRLFAGVSWSPDYRDGDGDGIANMNDRCLAQREDKDGFRDDDGCPDADNDEDGVADELDKCVAQREDMDGFQDEDGCPDTDNDQDGITDDKDGCPDDAEDKLPPRADDGCPLAKVDTDGDNVSDDKDKCPTEFEDGDGYLDGDGCPDPDNDGDAVLDRDDRCPAEAEDKDGTQDDDGCPDLDNDSDGVVDARDRCPAAAETINGVKDDDGCADGGGKNLATFAGGAVTLAVPAAWDGDRPRSAARPALEQAAMVMISRGDVGRWRIAVVAEKGAKAGVAAARAEAVKQIAVKRGLPAARVEVVAAEGDAAQLTITAVAKPDGSPYVPEEEPAIEIDPN